MSSFEPSHISSQWFKNSTIVTETTNAIDQGLSDFEKVWKYLLIICGIAFVVTIIALLIIRYFAGLFICIVILLTFIALILLAVFAWKEHKRLEDIAIEAHAEDNDYSVYYNSVNLRITSIVLYIIAGIFFFVVLFSLSSILLSIAVIKTASLFVVKNVFILFIPLIIALL